MAEKEVWKPIPGYKGYEASNLGRIRSRDRWLTTKAGWRRYHKGRVLSQTTDPGGYRQCLPNPRKTYVHRLVLLAFVGNRPNDMETRHLNGNKINNRVNNLRYGKPIENGADRIKHGRLPKGKENYSTKLTKAQVIKIRGSGMQYRQLARLYGVTEGCIRKIKNRVTWAWLDVEDSQTYPRMGHRNC